MRVRWTILARALCAITIASAAGAEAPVPSPSQSSIGAHILLEGSAPGAAPFDDCSDGRCGNYTVTVRDAGHAPIANSTVEINFGACSDITIASDQLMSASGQSYPAFKVVRGVTGPDGSFTFRIRGAATAAFTGSNTTSPGTNLGVTCATICADGVPLGSILVSAYDIDGHGSPEHAVNGADVALVSNEVLKIGLGGQARERDNYNGIGGVNGADVSLAVIFDLDALLGTGSYDTGTPGGTPVTFPIMIDCRALADSAVRLRGCSGSSCFGSRQVQSLALARGGYLLDECGGGCGIEPLIAFEVDSTGHVQYDPTLEPAVSGAGGTTLVVNSFLFPPRGDDIESSGAKFVIMIEPKFWPMMAGYPEFDVRNGVHRLSSPMLFDRTTTVGRSALLRHGDAADVGGTPVGSAGTMVADGDISFHPPGFEGAAGTPELHTEMRTLRLDGTSGVAVRAGTAAPDRPLSVGEIESLPGATGLYPAHSFFDIFAEVDLPALGGNPGSTTLYNVQPLLVRNDNLRCLPPPLAFYIHGNTGPVPVVFKADDTQLPKRWNAGQQLGWLVLAGHGFEFDSTFGNGAVKPHVLGDLDLFNQLFDAEPEMSDVTTLNVDLLDVVTFADAAAYTEPQDRDSLLAGLDQVESGTPCDGIRELAIRLMPRVDSTDTVPDWVQDPVIRALLSARMHALAESLQVRANASGGCTPLAVTPPPRAITWSTTIQYIHPNPMTHSTTIEYALRRAGPVTLAIYDLSGRRVSLLVDGDRTAGTHWASWNGRRDNGGAVARGVYFARLTSGGATDRRSIVVVQ